MECIQRTARRLALEAQKSRQFLIGEQWVCEQQAQDAPLTRGQADTQEGNHLPFLWIIPSGARGAIGQVTGDEATEPSRSLRRSRRRGILPRRADPLTLFLFVTFQLQRGRKGRTRQWFQEILQARGAISRKCAPVEHPGIDLRALRLGKTGKRTDERVKSQLQGCGPGRPLPVIALSLGSRKD